MIIKNQHADDSLARETLRPGEAVELSRRLIELTLSAKPLAEGLRALVEELPAGRPRRVAAQDAREIENGVSLEDVLESHSARFPGPLRGLVRAGLRTGRLGETLEQYAAGIEKEQSLFREIWSRFIYPCVLLLVALGLWLGLLIGIAPGFTTVFKGLNLILPWETRVLVSGSEAMKQVNVGSVFAFLGLAAVYVVLMRFLARLGLIRHVWGSGLFLRRLRRWRALSEFSSVAAILLDAGVPGDEALRLTSESARTFEMRKAANFAAVELASGSTLAAAVGRALPFSKAQLNLIAWAETAGTVPDAFRMLAEIFEALLERTRVDSARSAPSSRSS